MLIYRQGLLKANLITNPGLLRVTQVVHSVDVSADRNKDPIAAELEAIAVGYSLRFPDDLENLDINLLTSFNTPGPALCSGTVRIPFRWLKIEKISSLLEIYTFDEAAVKKYTVIREQLGNEGMVISERDTQIASIAMANHLTVVTHNVKEFGRIDKLKVEDWEMKLQNDPPFSL